MTSKERAAMELALDALQEYRDTQMIKAPRRAITALREALAEPDTDTMLWDSVEPRKKAEQEPVAWAHPSGGYLSARYMKEFATGLEKETHTIPLYAAPVPTKDLTVAELDAIIEKHYDDEMDLKAMILDGIAAYKEKNK